MRVASISKSFTAVAMARLWEDGKLDIDKPIQEYVPEFPEKYFEGSKVIQFIKSSIIARKHNMGIDIRLQSDKGAKCVVFLFT